MIDPIDFDLVSHRFIFIPILICCIAFLILLYIQIQEDFGLFHIFGLFFSFINGPFPLLLYLKYLRLFKREKRKLIKLGCTCEWSKKGWLAGFRRQPEFDYGFELIAVPKCPYHKRTLLIAYLQEKPNLKKYLTYPQADVRQIAAELINENQYK